jgi:RNA polymerase sigma-70 factor (ECF subfamily)
VSRPGSTASRTTSRWIGCGAAARALEQALAALPERQAAALVLVHLHGLTGAEACEVLGIGPEALESLLARGRRALKQRLPQDPPSGASA